MVIHKKASDVIIKEIQNKSNYKHEKLKHRQ